MERLHMNHLRDLINRLRSGESERRIAREMSLSRTTVRKYRKEPSRMGICNLSRCLRSPDLSLTMYFLGIEAS